MCRTKRTRRSFGMILKFKCHSTYCFVGGCCPSPRRGVRVWMRRTKVNGLLIHFHSPTSSCAAAMCAQQFERHVLRPDRFVSWLVLMGCVRLWRLTYIYILPKRGLKSVSDCSLKMQNLFHVNWFRNSDNCSAASACCMAKGLVSNFDRSVGICRSQNMSDDDGRWRPVAVSVRVLKIFT